MANYIRNFLRVKGAASRVQQVLDFVKGEPGTVTEIFDLNQIVPMPGSVQSAAELAVIAQFIRYNYPRYYSLIQKPLAGAEAACLTDTGYPNPQEWLSDKWGTLQNAHSCSYNTDDPPEIIFYTTWTPPLEAISSLSSRFPNVIIELNYYDECGIFFGSARFTGRDSCDERVYDDHIEEPYAN